jgi:hypothetical protein
MKFIPYVFMVSGILLGAHCWSQPDPVLFKAEVARAKMLPGGAAVLSDVTKNKQLSRYDVDKLSDRLDALADKNS